MRSKTIKITLEDLLETLLSHGIQLQKIEEMMADMGIPRSYIERALANIITIFPRRGVKEEKELSGLNERRRDFDERAELTAQIKEVRELIEKVYNKLFSTVDGDGPART